MTDNVNHPKHYTSHPSGVEAIEITRWLRGPYSNACKYVMRGWEGLKGDPIEDLAKAIWYLDDAEKFPDDGSVLSADADVRWLEYYEGEPSKEKKECLSCILIAAELEKWDESPSDTIGAAKKLIQERITYLQSRPDVALLHRILQRAELEEGHE